MVKIKGDGYYLSRTAWQSDAVFSILNELIRAGYIASYTAERESVSPDNDTIVIRIEKIKGGKEK